MSKPENKFCIGYGTRSSDIVFGHIHNDGVVSAAMIRNGDEPMHYISLEAGGKPHRKNGTICRSTGSFMVKAGDHTPNEQPGIFFDAVNGDIILNASNGRIRIIAENIDILAEGADGENGVVRIEGNESVIVKSPTVDIRAKSSAKFYCENKVDIIGNSILNIYGGVFECMDGATTLKGSKTLIPALQTITEIRQTLTSMISSITGM